MQSTLAEVQHDKEPGYFAKLTLVHYQQQKIKFMTQNVK